MNKKVAAGTWKVIGALNHVMNASGLCLFGYLSTDISFMPEFLTAVTGHQYSLDDLFVVGDRIATMRHVFNLREGINPAAWPIPERAYGRPPLPDGPTAGSPLRIEKCKPIFSEQWIGTLRQQDQAARSCGNWGWISSRSFAGLNQRRSSNRPTPWRKAVM